MKPPQKLPKRTSIVKRQMNKAAVIKQSRAAKWTQGEVARFLGEIGLGQELEKGGISESLEFAMILTKVREINSEINRANKALKNKELSHEQRIELMEAKCRLLEIHNEVSDRLRDLNAKQASSRGSGGLPAHAFNPREPVGPVQGVQITFEGNSTPQKAGGKEDSNDRTIDISKKDPQDG